MRDNGLLDQGSFVECGRGDLVGKYVGWTAPIVQKKFQEAKGGVLFIDEAYSLVDDKNGLYGDEAINTIVQEMENHRNEVVVIFAGYPDKMQEFVQRNPGLKSRIAFYVSFQDYNAKELLDITVLLAKKQGNDLSEEAKQKLLELYAENVKVPDFGNGRFVRNLLERAGMKQASRLLSVGVGNVNANDIKLLLADDFEIPETIIATEAKKIGFR